MQIANRYAWLAAVEIGMPSDSPPLVKANACIGSVALFLNNILVDKWESTLFLETNFSFFEKLASLANSVPNFDKAQCESEFRGKVFKYLKEASTTVYLQYKTKEYRLPDSYEVQMRYQTIRLYQSKTEH